MKAAVISLGSKSSALVAEALRKYIREVDELNIKDMEVRTTTKEIEVLHKGKTLDKYDSIYAKGSFRYAPILRAITSALSHKCYMPVMSETFTLAHDKLLTQLVLQKENIPMPQTFLTATPEAAKEILKKVNYPIIMKFPQGTQGKGVMFADSYPSASSMLDALIALRQPFIIQEYVETAGTDIRAIVVGDQVIAAMKRRSAGGEKRSNIHAGGSGEPVSLDAKTKKIAIQAAKAIGADICGVDILESVKGPLVIEINISPGLQGIMAATKIDIPDKIAKFLHKKTENIVSGKSKEATEEIMKDIESGSENQKEIITHLDLRGEKILLPELVKKATGFSDTDEVVLKLNKGKLEIERLNIGND